MPNNSSFPIFSVMYDQKITEIPADAIITAVHPTTALIPEDQSEIGLAANPPNYYYSKMYNTYLDFKDLGKKFENLDAIVVNGKKGVNNNGEFGSVIYVVDDVHNKKSPISDLMYHGLKAADEKKYSSLVVTILRPSFNVGAVEKSWKEMVGRMVQGANRYFCDLIGHGIPTSIKSIYFVVRNNPDVGSDQKLAEHMVDAIHGQLGIPYTDIGRNF